MVHRFTGSFIFLEVDPRRQSMTIKPKPSAEVAIDCAVVRGLLEEQHPDLAHLTLIEVGEGWDSTLFRLGSELVVRVPRRAASADLVQHEQRWLRHLSRRLPLPVPVPVRIGVPGSRFPWSWSITPWFPGQTALLAPPQDPVAAAVTLGQFVRTLHHPAPAAAPRNPWRGIPLAGRTAILHDHLRLIDGLVDRAAVLALWHRAVSTSPWLGSPLWIHGDLHPGNLLVHDGRLSAVIDFADLTGGDPATDLSVAWMLLPPPVRATFRAAARGPVNAIDDDTWMRARGWALALAVGFIAHSRDDAALGRLGHSTIGAVLNDA